MAQVLKRKASCSATACECNGERRAAKSFSADLHELLGLSFSLYISIDVKPARTARCMRLALVNDASQWAPPGRLTAVTDKRNFEVEIATLRRIFMRYLPELAKEFFGAKLK